MSQADVLIVIDMQNGVCFYEDEKLFDLDSIVPKINDLISDYTAQNKPIIFVQHIDDSLKKGSKEWEIIPELNTESANFFIGKTHPNSFYHTNLEDVLKELDAKTIEICGAETQYCVDSTVKFAHGLGYSVFMHRGLHTGWENKEMDTKDMIQFYEKIWDGSFVTFV